MTWPVTYAMHREGVLMRPVVGEPVDEAGGVLNPAVYRAEGRLWIMTRSVAGFPENFSRLGLAELVWHGKHYEVKREPRAALAPAAPYELLTPGPGEVTMPGGGCEDPRVTAIGEKLWLCYTGYGGDRVPRIALATSTDGRTWTRVGLARFEPLLSDGLAIDLNHVDNKDAMLFPERIGGRWCLMHRPMFPKAIAERVCPKQSIWLSYSDDLIHWGDHRLVAQPEHPWERLKLGGGTQPVHTAEGWLIVYHGVDGDGDGDSNRRYSAGVMVLDLEDPTKVLYRSPQPLLSPDSEEEKSGVVNNVVFPTGLWPAPDSDGWHVAYGMADTMIGLARLTATRA